MGEDLQLIRDRVRSGLARVKATGRTRSGRAIGRPKRAVDLQAVAELRSQGRSWREIAQALHVPRRTITRTWALEHNLGPVQAGLSPLGEGGWGAR